MNLRIPGYNPHTPNINMALETGHYGLAARLAFQNRRIHQGVKSGAINPQELQALKDQRTALGQTLTSDLRGGIPFNGQFGKLLNASSTDIYQYKHNA